LTVRKVNTGGFDVWLADGGGGVEIETNLGNMSLPLDDIGLDDCIMEAGGLARMIKVFRSPEEIPGTGLSGDVTIPLSPSGDNPLWVSIYTEDGFQAWSSPVFAYRQEA